MQHYLGNVSILHTIPAPRFIEIFTDDIALVTSANHKIFKVHLDGNVNKVEVFASQNQNGYKDGPALESQFDFPAGLAIDRRTKACYVADQGNNRIRRITSVVYSFAFCFTINFL